MLIPSASPVASRGSRRRPQTRSRLVLAWIRGLVVRDALGGTLDAVPVSWCGDLCYRSDLSRADDPETVLAPRLVCGRRRRASVLSRS